MLVNDKLVDACSVLDIDQSSQMHQFHSTGVAVNTVEIILREKTHNDTVLDENGVIVDDILLVIERLQIDHVDLVNKLDKISVYVDEHGIRQRTYNYITFNGSFKIKIHYNLLYTEWLASLR